MKPLVFLCVFAALVVAGCGSSNKSSSSTAASTSTSTSSAPAAAPSGGGQTLNISADPSALKYNVSSLSAKAGTVTIKMKNPGGLSHDVSIKGNGVSKQGNIVGQGGTSTVSADLKAGSYEFYCSVDGHEAAGMKGTLTVK
jgi:plastocyanin